jgi:hypothetical protein
MQYGRTYVKIVGIVLIFISIIIFVLVYLWEKQREHLTKILWFPLAIAIIGFVFTFIERVVEIPIPGVGTIKTVTTQAIFDAEEIKKIKERVENQSATIDLVSRKSADVEKLYEEASRRSVSVNNKIVQFESFLRVSQEEINSRLEALNPYTKPIITANCTMTVEAESSRAEKFKDSRHFNTGGGNGRLIFVRDKETLLALISTRGIAMPVS